MNQWIAKLPKRENILMKLALEREAKRAAREAAGEPPPVSTITPEAAERFRRALSRPETYESSANSTRPTRHLKGPQHG